MLVYISDTETKKEALKILFGKDKVTTKKEDIQEADILYLGPTGEEYKKVAFKPESHIYTLLCNPAIARNAQKCHALYSVLYDDPKFVNANTHITTEGLIGYIITNTNTSIYHSRILVIGYGRCGQDIVRVMQCFKPSIDVANRQSHHIKEVEQQGCLYIPLESLLSLQEYDYIINTVAFPVLTKALLQTRKKTANIFDIASYPYGVLREDRVDEYHVLPALPTRYAMQTAAELLYQAIIEKEDEYARR